MYKRNDKDNPFIMRQGETIVDLDRYVEVLKENNIPFTQDQYEEAKKNLFNLNKRVGCPTLLFDKTTY